MTTVITYAIYIVDDDQDLRELLKIALENKYQVRAFPAARPAIEAVEKDPPDLVILDIGLPDMSGIDALRTMRERHPNLIAKSPHGLSDGVAGGTDHSCGTAGHFK